MSGQGHARLKEEGVALHIERAGVHVEQAALLAIGVQPCDVPAQAYATEGIRLKVVVKHIQRRPAVAALHKEAHVRQVSIREQPPTHTEHRLL